ncbi:MAG: family 16 glycosylhydrolase [Clostridium sp.]
MKKSIIAITLMMGMVLMPLEFGKSASATENISNTKTSSQEKRFEFDAPDYQSFYMSDGWSNGEGFNCMWRKENIKFKDGIMNLTIDKDPVGTIKPYSGGEYATNETYGYGYYNVRMKPIKNDGVVSSFFTYVDKSGDEYAGIAHEIDIEFTGKDTTKVEFNYFTDGVSANGFIYELGFDASKEFHEYGFLWLPDSITWFVDGKEAFHTEGVSYTNYEVPSAPGHIMMNVWPGNSPEWLKPFDGKTPLTAQYDWASFKGVELEDIDLSGEVDLVDLASLALKYNLTSNDYGFKKQMDYNKDGVIDLFDLVTISKKIG